MRHEESLGRLIKKSLYVGAFAFILNNFKNLADIIYPLLNESAPDGPTPSPVPSLPKCDCPGFKGRTPCRRRANPAKREFARAARGGQRFAAMARRGAAAGSGAYGGL